MLISAIDYHHTTIGKSQVCKSIVIFVGINHLCAVSIDHSIEEENMCFFVFVRY